MRVDGKVNASVTNVVFPLGPGAASAGAGRGFLDLGDVDVQPGGFFRILLEVLGRQAGDRELIKFGKLDFRIEKDRLVYDNFTMVLPPDVDLRFFGSVGFDDSLDLWVSVPVRAALLKRMGVREPALAYAQRLSGLRVDLPIAGSRDNPQLDFSRVDVAKLVKEILLHGGADKGVEEGLGGLLKGIGRENENNATAAPAKPTKPAKPADKPAVKPRLRDRVKDKKKP
jgi:hypothetical protein